ncbi:sigma-54 interaction domain-containing protein [Haloimpatiens sp. FM7330]|uniref:sigma-54 interaction domain-containing protein n=1 Tax=Haloimpatiens sp. FM7330 TaxID=3298610 RepID=UPI003637D6CC
MLETGAILKSLIDNLELGIHIVNKEGKTVYYNEAMEQIEGLKKSEVIGKRIDEYLQGVNEDSSTIMRCLKSGKKIKDVIQRYSSLYGKKIITINTTVPVVYKHKVIASIEIAKNMTQIKELNEKLCKLQSSEKGEKTNYHFNDIIGKSKSIREAVSKAMRASLSNSSVLIYGETGCGKEVFAQSIHYNGIRSNKPFVPINCAAIPSSLLEGMLFGTTKGSFTGSENKKGLFEIANRGTILLDEINSMDSYLQSKLLRVLQEGYIRPIGSNKTIDIDVRIIATLNENPKKLIKEGKLRKDFYYRLSVIKINVPPLRKRKEDIELLSQHFIKYYNKILGKNVKSIQDKVMNKFLQYDWPGNVRELRNVIEYAMNMSDGEKILSREYFDSKAIGQDEKSFASEYDLNEVSLNEYLMSIEKKVIERELKKQNYNITKASKRLKISRQSLQYKIKKYRL